MTQDAPATKRITMHATLPGHTVMEVHALDGQLGLTMKVRVEGDHPDVDARVIDATVDADGKGYSITLEIPADALPVLDELAGISWSVDG